MLNPSDINTLKAELARSQSWVDRSTIAVFLGLLGDIFVTFFATKKKKSAELIFSILFTVLIAAGVYGEFKYGRQTASANSEIQTLSDANTARLDVEAAKANERAAQAEKETAELYALTAPRRLTVDQQTKIGEQLRPFSGREVTIFSYGMDGEGAAIGTQIIHVLNTAKIRTVNQLASSIVSGGFAVGIQIHGPNEQQDLVRALYSALHSTGKLDVMINAPALDGLAKMGGRAAMGGGASMGGGSGRVGPPGATPAGTPVTIQIGIKPIQQ
jgi:hypothetical protein